jgi:hypothetical protein
MWLLAFVFGIVALVEYERTKSPSTAPAPPRPPVPRGPSGPQALPGADPNAVQSLMPYAGLWGASSLQHAMPGIWPFTIAPVPLQMGDQNVGALDLIKIAHDAGFNVWVNADADPGTVYVLEPQVFPNQLIGIGFPNGRTVITAAEPWPFA